jgi:hypothetical protein
MTAISGVRVAGASAAPDPTPAPEPETETTAPLTPGGAFNAAATNSAHVGQDVLYGFGLDTKGDKGVDANKNAIYTLGIPAAAATAVGVYKATQIDQISGRQFLLNSAGGAVGTFATGTVKISPTLVSAVVGPAVADGVSYLAPNLVPKYVKKSPEDINSKNNISYRRGAVAAAAVGVIALGAFLIKPDLFKKAAIFSVSDEAMNGYTKVRNITRNGATVQTVKTVAGITADPVFSNRVLVGLVGGLTSAYLLNRALSDDDKGISSKTGIAGAAVGVATVGAIAGMRPLTNAMAGTNALAHMADDQTLFWKPNWKWMKEFGMKVVPFTATPAYLSASTYFNTFNDIGKITDSRSPFTK